jgi:hypothetical protein
MRKRNVWSFKLFSFLLCTTGGAVSLCTGEGRAPLAGTTDVKSYSRQA